MVARLSASVLFLALSLTCTALPSRKKDDRCLVQPNFTYRNKQKGVNQKAKANCCSVAWKFKWRGHFLCTRWRSMAHTVAGFAQGEATSSWCSLDAGLARHPWCRPSAKTASGFALLSSKLYSHLRGGDEIPRRVCFLFFWPTCAAGMKASDQVEL